MRPQINALAPQIERAGQPPDAVGSFEDADLRTPSLKRSAAVRPAGPAPITATRMGCNSSTVFGVSAIDAGAISV